MSFSPVPSLLREAIEDRLAPIVDCVHCGNLAYTNYPGYGVNFIGKYKVYGFIVKDVYYPVSWHVVVPLTETEQRLSDALDALYAIQSEQSEIVSAMIKRGIGR